MKVIGFYTEDEPPRATRVCGLMLILRCRFVGLGRKIEQVKSAMVPSDNSMRQRLDFRVET